MTKLEGGELFDGGLLWCNRSGHLMRGPLKEEQDAQGTVNHILDSSMDIVVNTDGILVGPFFLPTSAASFVSATGSWIPGPGDPHADMGRAWRNASKHRKSD
jgi:hypothetical protein